MTITIKFEPLNEPEQPAQDVLTVKLPHELCDRYSQRQLAERLRIFLKRLELVGRLR